MQRNGTQLKTKTLQVIGAFQFYQQNTSHITYTVSKLVIKIKKTEAFFCLTTVPAP